MADAHMAPGEQLQAGCAMPPSEAPVDDGGFFNGVRIGAGGQP